MKQTTPTFDDFARLENLCWSVSAPRELVEWLEEIRADVSAVAIDVGLRLVESSVIVYVYVIIYMRDAVIINYKLFFVKKKFCLGKKKREYTMFFSWFFF